MSIYDIGQEVRYWGTFADGDGTAYDPASVRFHIAPPGAPGTYLDYGTAAPWGTVLREGAGTYYADVLLTAGGYWRWGWLGSGTITTASTARDFVRYGEGNR